MGHNQADALAEGLHEASMGDIGATKAQGLGFRKPGTQPLTPSTEAKAPSRHQCPQP